ncbi:predicted protein [Lichtheimia corymbifera JMRC:FSU:9682]|uniref:Uncharacterized protein n=1 Tax=Lichtheimia corymbifera JMRC:FSU:9682 TaxID=1263082 RepID=A0A068RTA8_9FUNG|nr:predicted protein [Lichtheimia corymbifera JMRC:FSU:9682]
MIMKCICKKRISKIELDMMLTKLGSDNSMKKVIKDMDTVTFNSISTKTMTPDFDDISNYMKTIIAAGKLLEAELKDRDHANLNQLATFTDPVVDICNAGFSERITSANNTAVSAFLNNYLHCTSTIARIPSVPATYEDHCPTPTACQDHGENEEHDVALVGNMAVDGNTEMAQQHEY